MVLQNCSEPISGENDQLQDIPSSLLTPYTLYPRPSLFDLIPGVALTGVEAEKQVVDRFFLLLYIPPIDLYEFVAFIIGQICGNRLKGLFSYAFFKSSSRAVVMLARPRSALLASSSQLR